MLPTNETDRVALLKFKEKIPNDPFNIFTSWNDSSHFCKNEKKYAISIIRLVGYKNFAGVYLPIRSCLKKAADLLGFFFFSLAPVAEIENLDFYFLFFRSIPTIE